METTLVGDIVEAQCLAFLVTKGFVVSKPFSQRSKYDLILEKNNILYKIQCKHATGNSKSFNVVTSYTKRRGGKALQNQPYTKDEVDYFMTTFKNKFYLFRNDGSQTKSFRLVPPKKNQLYQINWAKDYEADLMLQKM